MNKFTDFYKKMTSDAAIAEDIKKIMEDNNVKSGTSFSDLSDNVLNAIAAVAKKAGFEFTLEEAKAYFAKKGDGELSDDELEAVAGGTMTTKPTREPCLLVGIPL